MIASDVRHLGISDMCTAISATLLTVFLAAPTDKPLEPGLAPGADLPGPFQPYAVTGKDLHRGKLHSSISEHGLDPTVLLFVRVIDAGSVNPLLQALEAAVMKYEKIRFGVVVVFISDDIQD